MRRDAFVQGALGISAAAAALVLLLVVWFVMREAMPAVTQLGPRLFGDAGWYPAAEPQTGQFNLAPMLAGSLIVATGAILVAVPAGILSALYGHGAAPTWLRTPLRSMLELLAGIPSVVYGLWGLVVLVPMIQGWQPPGASVLAGILVLALMIVPTVALFADAALRQVPMHLISAAAALGMRRWTIATKVMLPAARHGIGAGVMLAFGRALGETLAMVMVCGNIVQVPASLFDPVRTLTANIALEMAYAQGAQRSALFASGLALLGLVILISGLARRAGGVRHA
ncbi:MAG: phosphate ABC transporter permease subunit PstC [Candidatus Macondimonas sp.]